MRGRSLASRVTRGMALVAGLSSLLLACAAALVATLLWQAEQRRQLNDEAEALVAAIDREVREERLSPAGAAPEALRESTISGARVEVWSGDRLLGEAGSGPRIGPSGEAALTDWIVHRRPLPDGLMLVMAAPAEYGRRAVRVFASSFLLAAPVCLGVALWVGRNVVRRSTRPLIDLQTRIRGLRGLDPLGPPTDPEVPAEIADVEDAFRALWQRLSQTMQREHDFAANASHELRLPLARIRLLAERARMEGGPAAAPVLDAQIAEVDRLVRLVESLLVLARDSAQGLPHGETVNLADVARRVSGRVLDGNGECVFPDEVLVRGDEDLIEIAVQNLLENARKFAARSDPVRAVLSEAEGQVRLEVTTPGARIASAECERLFDRFYRAPEARARSHGHGLGLALARHVARLHGGDVQCLSADVEDARFALDLPAWGADAPPAR